MSDLFAAAEKTLANYSWYSYIYDSERNEREGHAITLYLKAAEKFRSQAHFKEAAESYLKAFQYSQQKESLIDAFNCYLKSDLPLAGQTLKEIARHYTDQNKLAKHQQQLAEKYKAEENYVSAIIWYDHASENYTEDGRRRNCLLQIANLYADKLNNYRKATLYYERTADLALGSPELPEYLLKAGLCSMHVLEMTQFKKKVEKYADISTFVTTGEYALLMKMVSVLEKKNPGLANKILEMNNLDKWRLPL